ncbi:MAG: PEPxxWA-CTERM sorting domain-containing protein [Sphingomonas bacterium]|nr:PEPxxWA-CTERM sorting domain-containing protein [Sphingomonas bacterium]
MKFRALGLMAAFFALTPSPAAAQQVVAGFTTNTVARCDDCFTAATPLGFTANYFGTNYANTFVSNNGYLTFNTGQGSFTPSGLGASYAGQPIIAAFFADVDTRPANGGFTQFGTGTFNGMTAFGATWTDVGYFASQTDITNTFQILLVNRSDVTPGDFDIYLNYNRILWETGAASGGVNGFGGTSAAAGYNAGQGGAAGTFFEFAGSRTPGSLINGGPNALVSNSNIGVDGRFLFNVRNGQVLGAVPEPGTWAMMLVGFGAIGAAMRRSRRQKLGLSAA